MVSKLSKSVPAIGVALILLLSPVQPVTAQNSATQQELSEPLAALVRNKLQMIEVETENANEEWAGRYRAADGPTVTTDLAWSPVSGFIVWWYNCSRPTSARANHGAAVFENGLLKITPQESEDVPGSFTVASEFVPVKWGAQHFLIPRDELMKFIYAVNSRSEPELETFLMKLGDSDKTRKGGPAVPSEYMRYLGMKPITATVSTVGPKSERWYPKVTLNVGNREGVIPGMKFYRLRRGGPFIAFEVTTVGEHTSEAQVALIGGTNGDGNVRLRRGWTLSSRAPKNIERFYP
jgi:hypothetical protein